ncbi:MAG: hypothetical protein O7J95_00560 [Planctomycetota bacterium]|nr:hypothetical protein [Planctomycetota bacterium]
MEYVEEASDPLVDPLAGRSDDSDEPFVNPLKGKRAKPDAGSGENRFFTLALSGTLEGKPIDPNDPQTWARLGYFLQRNSPLPFHLVYPGGYVPLVMKKGRGGRLIEKRPDENSPVPRGDRSNPSYKIVLDVSVRSAGDVKFYGKSLASKYISTLSGRIEKRTGGEFRTLERFSVSQTRTPSKDNPLSGEKLARTIYDVSLDQLVRKLKSLPPFAGP